MPRLCLRSMNEIEKEEEEEEEEEEEKEVGTSLEEVGGEMRERRGSSWTLEVEPYRAEQHGRRRAGCTVGYRTVP